MKRDVTYRCEGPGCDTHQQAPAESCAPRPGWVLVHEHGDPRTTVLDFCSWDCVLRFAGEIPPVEVVELDFGGAA